ncbi:ABC transporter ATP-binding protein [Desulfurivibrio dismutans]|uniref:ABC transporter ATP-binding protein n=1 Tax=Desulfurivibrio dismutans TaxID=1398908 RepID=UPI0023DB269C|nr:ABC transporter ATP-binding protein [Desulfurivibrio alkaliphilus]MDF1615104.1 ABC transporter ATP-binding protein [Desulfurivibrio alkaliphilus]
MKTEIKQLTVTYREDDHRLLALDRVDLQLLPGRITALVGESGSGKTTLGKALLGLLPPAATVDGQILLGEDDLTALDETARNQLRWRRAAVVPQNGAAALNPAYRLLDQVAEPLRRQRGVKRREAEERALAGLAELGLDRDQARRYPHELSGGQVQRGLLAMALILDPPLLILDEPTAALDCLSKNHLAQLFRRLAAQQKSLLLITHDLALARQTADQAAVIYLGRIMEYLPAGQLDRARHPYTVALYRSFPGMDAVRDLGGIRGDAFYRLLHAHPAVNVQQHRTCGHDHQHLVTPASNHPEEHAPPGADEDGHAPAAGCLFAPRCTQAEDACRREAPALNRLREPDAPQPDIDQGHEHQIRCRRGGIIDLLCCRKTSKSYGPVTALHPVDLELRAGEVCCLVGESGSGKTTLAMLAAGALEPDRGRVSFAGRDLADWRRRDPLGLAARIGIIHQQPAEAVSHRFTVFEIVAEPLRIQRPDLDAAALEQRVLTSLAEVRLATQPEFLRRYPHQLNLGAIQRLCLARALIQQPQLLVADEPTSALDPSVQAKVLKLLLELQIEKGLTLLLVTHDLGLARKIADRLAVMEAGRLVESGPAARVLSRPAHSCTARLIAAATTT